MRNKLKLPNIVWSITLGYCGILGYISQFTMAYRPQEIILYSNANFTGKQKSYYESFKDLTIDSVGSVARSHCVVRGLWRITGLYKANPTIKFMENAYGDEKNGNVCGSWNTPNKTAKYTSIHFIGAEDLETPALSLNTGSRFFGQELYFDGTLLKLPEPLKFNSFGFTGKENWTVYKTTDLSGTPECLSPNIDPLGDYGVTFNTNKSLIIGSISRGCGQEEGIGRTEPDVRNDNDNKPTKRPNVVPGKGKNSGSKSSLEFLIGMIALLSPTLLL